MKKILVIATAGAGGDLQPLMAAALGMRARGHTLSLIGDSSVARAVNRLGLPLAVTRPDQDLGPRLIAVIRESQGLPESERGEVIRRLLSSWSADLARAVREQIRVYQPDLLLTSLFGAEIAFLASRETNLPWSIINSTFYIGPNPPRPLEMDFSPRAVPLFHHYFAQILDVSPLVLHATDRHFDFDFEGLPEHHFYVGPLIWESDDAVPAYLHEPGDPWVLVTVSSQLQDDISIAQTALNVLAQYPVRVALTLGQGHQSGELEHIPGNAYVEPTLKHSQVLEASRLLVSHAGHGSVMKALWYGVPMVLVPWGRDQPGVAARAEHLGAAQVISREQLTEARLAGAITSVLGNPLYQSRAKQESQRLRMQDPVATACDLLEKL